MPPVLLLVLLLVSPATAVELLVVGQGNEQVLEYDGASGAFLSVFVDPVAEGFVFPGGIAVSPADGRLYVASTASGEIWPYDFATGAASPPVVASGLLAPTALDFDAGGGALYFLADIPNGPSSDAALRKLTLPGGGVSTLASDATASFAALAVQGSHVYVSDSFNGEVVRFPVSGGSGTTIISGLSSPGGLVFRSATELLVAETGADRVLEYDESGGSWSLDRVVLAGGVDGPFGMSLAPDGRLTVVGAFSNDALAVDLTTLVASPLVAAGAGGLAAAGQALWNGGSLLVASRGGNAVPYYDASGSPTGTVARGLTAPPERGSFLSPGGSLWVASAGANNVVEYDASHGGALSIQSNACPLSFTSPFDVTVDAAGELYVTCAPTDGVRTYDTAGSAVSFVVPGSGGLTSPRGLAFGPGGNLFVASQTGEVLEYAGADGSFVGVFIDDTGNGGGPMDPYGLVFRGGSLFVVSSFANEVKEFDAVTGAFVQTLVSAGSGGLGAPTNLAFDAAGDVYVTSPGDDTVKRYDGVTGAYLGDFVAAGSGGLDGPFDLAFRSAPPPPSPVPALHGAGSALLVASLLVGARVAGRRSAGRRG